jgi:hypothetical protein
VKKQRSASFLKKRSKKLSRNGAMLFELPEARKNRSFFATFFSKKVVLSLSEGASA